MMRLAAIAVALVCGAVASGCARKDMPVSQFELDQPPQRFAACVVRNAQAKADFGETIHLTRLDEPEEVQVTKSALYGSLVWEMDATATPSGGSRITMRHHPGLVGWDKELLGSMNACAGVAPLRRV